MTQNKITLSSILRFGDPKLECSSDLVNFREADLLKHINQLTQALELFQQSHKWGRSIAAPQLGIMKQIIITNTLELPKVIINPEISWHSTDIQTVWDDCMSLPEIAVEVDRWKSISVTYQTADGDKKVLERLSPDNSELLQHEIDHLHGVIMTKRMTNKNEVISRDMLVNKE